MELEIMIDQRFIIWTAKKQATSCIVVLPGRGQHAAELAQMWLKSGLEDTMFVAVTPTEYQWYPMPNNSEDQDDAVAGLETARLVVESVLTRIESEFAISRDRIAIVGFSAGGVMANYVAMHTLREIAGIACHGGAILEPYNIPECAFPDMPMILTHNEDDDVFDWQERYLPMRDSLISQNYNVCEHENEEGGHHIQKIDILYSACILAPRLGYSAKWVAEKEMFVTHLISNS